MKYCDQCGNDVGATSAFCKKCGRKIASSSSRKEQNEDAPVKQNGVIDSAKGARVAVRLKCSNCGHTGQLKKLPAFNFLGILWLLTTVWGVIVYYMAASPYICEKCKKRNFLTKVLNDRSEKKIKTNSNSVFYILNVSLLILIGIPSMISIYGDYIGDWIRDYRSREPLSTNTIINVEVPDSNINQHGVAPSVVNILCPYADEDFSIYSYGTGGSGTFYNEEGLVLTNSHIFEQDEEFIYIHDEGCLVISPHKETGGIQDIYIAEPLLYEESSTYDLAYLEITDVFTDDDGYEWGSYPRQFPALSTEACSDEGETIKLGDKVIIYGYPSYTGGANQTITEGIISSFSDDGLITTSAKIDAGNSGGLALDPEGCMIGVPVAVSEGVYESIGYIIPGNMVDEFMELTLEEE